MKEKIGKSKKKTKTKTKEIQKKEKNPKDSSKAHPSTHTKITPPQSKSQ